MQKVNYKGILLVVILNLRLQTRIFALKIMYRIQVTNATLRMPPIFAFTLTFLPLRQPSLSCSQYHTQLSNSNKK